jgi:hypothetical protein
MTQFDYEVITADKIPGVTKEAATAALENRYPDHLVLVEELGNEFVATLARKSRVGKTTVAAGDEPFDLLEDETDKEEPKEPKEKGLSEEDGPKTPKEPKEPKAPKGLEDSLKDEGEDEGDGDAVSQILDALKALEKFLPKVKEQLSGLGGGEDLLDTPELGDLKGPGGLGGPPGPGGPGKLPGGPGPATGPEGLGPLDEEVGPVPGGKVPRPPRRPGVPSGKPRPDAKPVGVPTFGNVKKNKVVIRPRENEDGTLVSLAQATQEIETHPKYAGYEIVNIKPDGDTFKAHLRYRQG